jgi:DNA-binding MarR family transcriptional regulator
MEKGNKDHPELPRPQSYKVHWDIVLLAREITKTFEFIFSEFDLNLTDVALISLIDQNDAFTQSQLAKSLGIGKARLGIVIKGLEIKNILERTVDPYDRRVWIIKLTQEGDALREQLEEKYFMLKDLSNEFVDLQTHQNLADNLNVFRVDMTRLRQEIEERI